MGSDHRNVIHVMKSGKFQIYIWKKIKKKRSGYLEKKKRDHVI